MGLTRGTVFSGRDREAFEVEAPSDVFVDGQRVWLAVSVSYLECSPFFGVARWGFPAIVFLESRRLKFWAGVLLVCRVFSPAHRSLDELQTRRDRPSV